MSPKGRNSTYSEALKKYLSKWKGEDTELIRLWAHREDKEISYGEIKNTMEEKGWYERKICRSLKRLCDDQVLIKKKLGRRTYYRLSPNKQMLIRALGVIQYLEEMVDRIKDSVWSAYFPLQISIWRGSIKGMDRTWYQYHPHPFWEYCSDLTVFGLPDEDELLPIEKIVFYHYIDRLRDDFMKLAWLRTAVLSRRLLNVQLPLDDFLRDVLFDLALKKRPLDPKELTRIQKLRSVKLIRKIRKILSGMESKEKIALPQPTPKLNLWKVLRDLRTLGKVNNFAIIATAGPKKVVKKGDFLAFGDEKGEPLPPLDLPEKEGATGKPIIVPCSGPPKFSMYNPTPFPVQPKMIVGGYEYKIKEIKDPKIIKKLKKGQLPIALTLP